MHVHLTQFTVDRLRLMRCRNERERVSQFVQRRIESLNRRKVTSDEQRTKVLTRFARFQIEPKSFAHRKLDHENQTSCAIRHLQFGFLNQSMRFPVCRFSARLERVRHGQPAWTRPCVLERVCSIKPGKPSAKGRATRKTQIRLQRNPLFSERNVASSGSAMCYSPWPDPNPVRVLRHRFCRYCPRRIQQSG